MSSWNDRLCGRKANTEICELEHQFPPFGRYDIPPCLERFAGSCHGDVDIFNASSMDGGDFGFITGVDACDLLAGFRFNEFVIDEETCGLGVLVAIGSCELDGETVG